MDFQLWPPLDEELHERLVGCLEHLLVAGAVRSIVSPLRPSVAEFRRGRIELACRLHAVRRAVFVGHTDCWAHGGRVAFEDDAVERAAITGDRCGARAVVAERCPGLDVCRLRAVLTPGGEGWRVTVEPVADSRPARARPATRPRPRWPGLPPARPGGSARPGRRWGAAR